MARTLQQIRADLRATRAEMHAKGIKRIACFNGGLHGEVYSLNARMFALETERELAEKTAAPCIPPAQPRLFGI